MCIRWIDANLRRAFEGVPCQAEFFRYVQWHNLAFATTRELALPTLVIHYENYTDALETTLSRILNFLEMPEHRRQLVTFHPGKVYPDFYTTAQRESIWRFLNKVAKPETRKNIIHYMY